MRWGLTSRTSRSKRTSGTAAPSRVFRPRLGIWLAERIPNSFLTCWPEHGHFTWMASDNGVEVICPDQRYNPSN